MSESCWHTEFLSSSPSLQIEQKRKIAIRFPLSKTIVYTTETAKQKVGKYSAETVSLLGSSCSCDAVSQQLLHWPLCDYVRIVLWYLTAQPPERLPKNQLHWIQWELLPGKCVLDCILCACHFLFQEALPNITSWLWNEKFRILMN